MPTPCTLHPTQPAHWQCPRCQSLLCPQCISRRDIGSPAAGQPLHCCLKCGIEARWLGAGNIVEPFWKRLPRFFTYPLHPRPLTLMAVFSLVALVRGQNPGVLTILLAVTSYCVMLLYSFAALRGTANGDLTPPPLNRATLSRDFGLVLKQAGIYVIIATVFFLSVAKLGIFFGGIVLIAALLGMPAMVILLVTTGSLVQAVNPLKFIPLATRIGWGYLLMYLFLILLGGAPQALAGKVLSVMPAFAAPVLTTAAKFYYMLISYHLMGYVLVQYHMDIGYTIEQENFKESEAPDKTQHIVTGEEKILQDVALMLRSGEVENAITHIQENVAPGAMTSLVLSERYMKMLKLKKMGTALAAHFPIHLNLMAGANLKSEALSLYRSPLARKTDVPLPADIRFKIAGWLNEIGNSQEALTAYQHIIDEDTDLALIPKAHLRMAQIYHDRLMQPEIARGILDEAIGRFPDGAVADQMRAYRRHLGLGER